MTRRAWWPVAVLFALAACFTPRPPIVSPPAMRAVAVVVTSNGTTVAGAAVVLDDVLAPHTGATNADGYVLLTPVPASLGASHLWVTADGYQPYSRHVDLPPGNATLTVTLTALPPPMPRQVRGQLQARGCALTYPDGEPFIWRGATAFALNALVSSGHADQATAFAEHTKSLGFNVVRVLVMLPQGWFATDADFTPEEGLAALPQTLALLKQADLYAHVTVLANTAAIPEADFAGYVERTGAICAIAENCALVEVANEPMHETQASRVHDLANLAAWAQRVPSTIPTALGSPDNEDGSQVAAAPVIVIHLDRSRDRWNRVRRVRELETVSVTTGRYVVDSEPMGADELEQSGRRDNLPEVFYAQGALSRVFSVGSTFHSEAGLQAVAWGPVQEQCAARFIAGTHVVPDTARLAFQNAGWASAPVTAFRFGDPAMTPDTAVRAYSGVEGATGITVLVGVAGDPAVAWGGGWHGDRVLADMTGVRVWAIVR